MNKSLITNLISLLVTVAGFFSPIYSEVIFFTGLFALSGGMTNWLAIHMLFERIPFLYGSGVIPNRFEEFRIGIKKLIMEEFFNKNNLNDFFKQNEKFLTLETLTQEINFDNVFEGLKETIAKSSFGGMLNMVGGKESLNPLKEPITKKLKQIIDDLSLNSDFNLNNAENNKQFSKTIESIIDKRLNELTPTLIKKIMQEMIQKHLGWLVVWGGVFGGIIGFVIKLIK